MSLYLEYFIKEKVHVELKKNTIINAKRRTGNSKSIRKRRL